MSRVHVLGQTHARCTERGFKREVYHSSCRHMLLTFVHSYDMDLHLKQTSRLKCLAASHRYEIYECRHAPRMYHVLRTLSP